jgi:hypothetical protein
MAVQPNGESRAFGMRLVRSRFWHKFRPKFTSRLTLCLLFQAIPQNSLLNFPAEMQSVVVFDTGFDDLSYDMIANRLSSHRSYRISGCG